LTQWITLLGTLGVGTLVASVLTRWSVISNLRQNWINAIRDDLAVYLKEIDAVNYRRLTNDVEKKEEARQAAMLVYRRIILRLNLTEQPHINLAESLKGLLNTESPTADSDHIDIALIRARRILKQEWRVTKYGVFARLFQREAAHHRANRD
jgi:hypothetical protein